MLWTIPVATFLVNIGMQWWAFWYPGAEPGGGGYIAQRIFSARDERQGLLSVLWFNVAHYAIRPWPWILTALSVIVLYPGLAHPETGFMLVMNNTLPHSMRGLAIAGFLAAFMSTVATQLNWGASYLVSDFYRRFLRPEATNRHYVMVSRLATVLLVIASAWVSVHLESIARGWQVVMEVGAGTGAVYLLRWYWWRINAWSEISAMACSLAVTVALNALHPFQHPGRRETDPSCSPKPPSPQRSSPPWSGSPSPSSPLPNRAPPSKPSTASSAPTSAAGNPSQPLSRPTAAAVLKTKRVRSSPFRPPATSDATSPPGSSAAPWSTSASSAPANSSSTNRCSERSCSLSPPSPPSPCTAPSSPASPRSPTQFPQKETGRKSRNSRGCPVLAFFWLGRGFCHCHCL